MRLEVGLLDGVRILTLGGPTGSGKTLLLHVLGHRLDGDFQCIYVPYSKLSPTDFFQWALAALNEPEKGDPESALRGRIERDSQRGFPPLLWMIDDAISLPTETLLRLADLVADLSGAMGLILVRPEVFSPDVFVERKLETVDAQLEGELEGEDLTRYVQARLEYFESDEKLRETLEHNIEQLRRRSGGNPGLLHLAASQLLRSDLETVDTNSRCEATYIPQA